MTSPIFSIVSAENRRVAIYLESSQLSFTAEVKVFTIVLAF
jgi:hypothetical protein